MNETYNPFELINTRLSNIDQKIDALKNKVITPESKPVKPDKLISTKEVCNLLSISRVTVWNWEKKRILHPIRIGNMKRYRLSDIETISNINR
jgi:predicted DNA-binding transcriptional regulator AlpA